MEVNIRTLKNASYSAFGFAESFEDKKKDSQSDCTDKNYNSCILLENKEQENMKKRTDNRYVKTVLYNKKRYYVYGATQLEANKRLIKLKKELHQREENQKYENHNTLNNWLEKWYKLYKKPFIKENTQADIENIIFNHLSEFGKIKLNKITTESIQKYLNTLPQSRTKEKISMYLRVALEKAFALGKIKTNPFTAVEKEKRINNKGKAFTYEEQAKILKRLKNEEIQPLILFYLLTGIRKEEIVLKNVLECIDEEKMLLKVVNLKQHDNKTHYKYIDITIDLLNLIKANIEVFKNHTPTRMYRKFAEILKELNISGSTHTLRFTFATNHFYLGTPDKIIADWMGHSTIVLTKDIYTTIDRTISKEKIKLLYNNLYREI